MAAVLALAGRTQDKHDPGGFNAAASRCKRAPSTHINFADRGPSETRGKPPHDTVLRIQHPKPTEICKPFNLFTHPGYLTAYPIVQSISRIIRYCQAFFFIYTASRLLQNCGPIKVTG